MKLDDKRYMELKQAELDILKHFIEACNQMNLRYYVIAGTLIGAVRHKGSIPWDDDIDVAMPRTDYETFIAKGKSLLPDNLFIQTRHTDPGFLLNMAKVRNSNTAFLEKTNRNLTINQGIYIDVFPLDNFINRPLSKLITKTKLKVLKTAIGREFFRDRRSLKLRINQGISKILYPSSADAMNAFDHLIQSVRQSEYCHNYCHNYGFKEACPWSWFGSGVDMEFEGITVRAPKEFDRYLRGIYGDYMELPAVSERIPHHNAEVVDVHNSYLTYIGPKGEIL
ncbi:MAG: LicD family protein [Clostridia bacterium]|nr:LicD family protein [Clostridia bacterium]